MSTDDEKQSLDDAIERLEAEHRRRIDEKVERGEAIRAADSAARRVRMFEIRGQRH
jgi:hypothetical protein